MDTVPWLVVTPIILLVGILAVLRLRDDAARQARWDALALSAEPDAVFDEGAISDLPAPAQRYLRRAIAPGTLLARSAVLTMAGTFRSGAERPWMPLTAAEIIAPECGFVWRAWLPLFGPVGLAGGDYYLNGEGRFRFWLAGLIPLIGARGPDISRSAAGRLLSEGIWLPAALLPARGALWEAVDDQTARVRLTVDDVRSVLTMTVDPDGALRQVVLPRWQEADGRYQDVPFGVAVEEERTFGGFTIPSRVRGGWWFGTGRYFEYFRFAIEDAVFR